MTIIPIPWEVEIRRIMFQGQTKQIVLKILSQKHPSKKRAGCVAQVVEGLPSKSEALNANPNTTKKIFFLTVLDARSSKSRWQQGQNPSKSLGEDPSLPFQLLVAQGVPWIKAAALQSYLGPSMTFSCVSLCPLLLWLYRETCHWI